MSKPAVDYYKVLNVAPTAEGEVISAAFRALMKKYHPDQNRGDASAERRAKEINEAHDILSDPVRRASYDQQRVNEGGTNSRSSSSPNQQSSRDSSTNQPPPGQRSSDRSSDPKESTRDEPASGSPPVSRGGSAVDDVFASRSRWAAGGWSIGIIAAIGAIRACSTQPATTSATTSMPAQVSSVGTSAATPPASAPVALVQDQAVSWDAVRDGSPKLYTGPDLQLSLEAEKGPDGRAAANMTVSSAHEGQLSSVGLEGGDTASATLISTSLDPRQRGSGVLVATSSFGAHCCYQLDYFERLEGHIHKVSLTGLDGESSSSAPRDVDGDGIPDIVLKDDRFGYVFAAYAGSWFPPTVYNIVGGVARDVSHSDRYISLYRSSMVETEKSCREHNNGACAAFVAEAARVGQFEPAWQLMLANYDQHDPWELPSKCALNTGRRPCPVSKTERFSDFPAALRWFLERNGYISPSADPLSSVGDVPASTTQAPPPPQAAQPTPVTPPQTERQNTELPGQRRSVREAIDLALQTGSEQTFDADGGSGRVVVRDVHNASDPRVCRAYAVVGQQRSSGWGIACRRGDGRWVSVR